MGLALHHQRLRSLPILDPGLNFQSLDSNFTEGQAESQRAGHSLPESRSGGVAKQVSQIPRPMGESWGLGSYEAYRDTRQEERHTEW